MRAYIDGQDAGARHKIMPAMNTDNYRPAGINLCRPMTGAEIKLVGPQFNALRCEVARAPNGVTAFTFDN